MMQETKSGRLFIVGVGRSGTSLLQSMLNAHPSICFPPEINFIRRFLATSILEETWAKDKASLEQLLSPDELIARLNIGENTIRAILDSLSNDFSARELYVRLLDAYAKNTGKENATWIGDKDPRSVEYLPLIHRCFPDARILHIIRDPRDVLASKKKAAWSKNQSPLRHIFANRVQLHMGRTQGPKLFGDHYNEFSYEDLLRDPTNVLSTITSFLNVDFDPAMLEFSKSSKQLVSNDEMDWKKETFEPLNQDNFGKWLDELTPWEAALTEHICSEAFAVMHYEKSVDMSLLNPAQRLSVPLIKLIMASLEPVYGLYRRTAASK